MNRKTKPKITSKTVKKQPKDAFSNTEVRALIEEFRSDFRVFGEDLTAVKDRQDMIFIEVGKQKEKITMIHLKITAMKNEQTAMGNEISEIKFRLTNLEKNTQEIKNNTKKTLKYHESRLNHLESVK